jgi:hypothetical protein
MNEMPWCGGLITGFGLFVKSNAKPLNYKDSGKYQCLQLVIDFACEISPIYPPGAGCDVSHRICVFFMINSIKINKPSLKGTPYE